MEYGTRGQILFEIAASAVASSSRKSTETLPGRLRHQTYHAVE